MATDSLEIFQKINVHLESHIDATLQTVSEELGISGQTIEQIINEVEHISFQELQENRRLAQAFDILKSFQAIPNSLRIGQRARPRVFVPWTTVRYATCYSENQESNYSNQCPVTTFNITGLAFLADDFLKLGTLVSLLMTLPEEDATYRLKGHVIYSIEADIAGYSHRLGVKFVPFADEEDCNSPNVLDVLAKYEKAYHAS